MMNSDLKKLEREKQTAVSHNKWKDAADKCNFIGSELSRLGQHEKALEFHNEELSYNDMVGDRLGIAIANRKIGECHSEMNHFGKALSHIETFKKISVELGDIVEEQRAWATLGRTFYMKYLNEQAPDDLNKAERAYIKALKLIDALKSKLSEKELAEMKSRCLLNLGLVSEHKGKIQHCGKCIQMAIYLAQKFGLHEDLNRCQSSLASVYQKHGHFAKALELMDGAIATATKLRDKTLLCDELTSKALILISLKDFDAAKHCLKKAYKMRSPIKEDHDRISKLLKICIGLCVSQNKLQDIDSDDFQERKSRLEKIADGLSAMECYELAIEYYLSTLDCMEEGDFAPSKKAPIYSSIAMTYVDLGKDDKALEYFNGELLCNDNKPLEQVKTLWEMGEIFKKRMELKEGEDVYLKALSLAQRAGKDKHLLKAYEKLVLFYEEYNMTDKAEATSKRLEDSGLQAMVSDAESEEEDTQDPFEDICLSELSAGEDSDAETKKATRPRRHLAKPAVRTNELGETPLHKACIDGNIVMVKRLVESGSSVNAADNNGWTPLHEACNYGYLDVVEYLLDNGALINKRSGKNGDGITALHDSASNGHFNVIQLLLSRGASATVTDKDNNTPLDALMEWKMSSLGELDEHDLEQCKKAEEELRNRMAKAGVSARDYEGGDFANFFDELDRNANQEQEAQSRQSMPDLDEDSNQSSLKRSREASSASESDGVEDIETYHSQPTMDGDWDTPSGAQTEYQSVMTNLRRSAQTVISQPKVTHKENIPALLQEEQVVNDWLIMDTKQPVKTQQKKRRKVSRLNIRTSKSLYNYLEPKEETCIPPPEESEVSIIEVDSNKPSNSSRTTLMATTNNLVIPTPSNNCITPFNLRVRVCDDILFVPVPEDSCTYEWLAEEVGRRYQAKHLRRPHVLSFTTIDGSSLDNTDIIKSTLVSNTEINSVILNWEEPSLEELYTNLCILRKLTPKRTILAELRQFTSSNWINLSNSCLEPEHIGAVFESLSRHKTVTKLHLESTLFTSSILQKFISCCPSFVSLVSLDLSTCAILTCALRCLSEFIDTHPDPFPCLQTLLLNYNLFNLPCSKYISSLLNIPHLVTLELISCDLHPMVFEDPVLCQTLASCNNLQQFNVSHNLLSDISLKNLLHHLPKQNLTSLNLTKTTRGFVDLGITLQNCMSCIFSNLTELSLENCCLTERDLSLLATTTFLYNLPKLKSLDLSSNPNLSSRSICRFLKVVLKREQPLDVCLVNTCDWTEESIDELVEEIDFKCLRSLQLQTDFGREKIFRCWERCWGDSAVHLDGIFYKLSLSGNNNF